MRTDRPKSRPRGAPSGFEKQRVAVIDIGSNTIKLLVAAREPAGSPVRALFQATVETRLSRGLIDNDSVLSTENIEKGIDTVRDLLEQAAPYRPASVKIVATSALREARNRDAFARKLLEATGHELRILSGEEEARAIARGLERDPVIAPYEHFHVFDVGGGSLEGLEIRSRKVVSAVSLPLGAVRLTDAWVNDPRAPFTDRARKAVEAEVASALRECDLSLTRAGPVVATGGALAAARDILAARAGRTQEEQSPLLPVVRLEALLREIGGLPLDRRAEVPRLPPGRADIMPVALTVFLTIASLTGADEIVQSNHNLRFGLISD